jgi:methyltransferase (TIGR00027 family)
MKAGHESQTAVLVCMARAAADGNSEVARYSDPTAIHLLPPDARAFVVRFRSGAKPSGMREGFKLGALRQRARMMVARTVVVDDAVREADSPQLVILGAGLDGRAWRMPELSNTVVFEVDHPDSQREKRKRIARLAQAAREVRFVPVDFERDKLDDALAAAGHDPTRQTTWIWEGVVMYLALPDIEATLAVIAHRSTVGSRLIIVYHAPALMLKIVGWMVRRVGEPLRSAFKPLEMRALLSKHGFSVLLDEDIRTTAAKLSPTLLRSTRLLRHMRTVVAKRT